MENVSQLIGIIQGCVIERATDIFGKETVYFIADADIDRDGSQVTHPNTPGTEWYDPFFEPDTTLHGPNGTALDPFRVPFVVVPPLICENTKGVVLGSECLLTNTLNGRQVLCVVGDIGPHRKIGEISPDAAVAIGVNPNPRHGGESRHVIDYEIHVGKAALIDGVQYQLKHWKSQ